MIPLPDDPEARDALAAEYVLGTLEAHEAAAVEMAVAGDPVLQRLVHDWEQRLAPLTSMAVQAEPPPGLWGRIDRALGPVPLRDGVTGAAISPPSPAAQRVSGFWRGWALASTAAAAVLLGWIVLRPVEAPRLMTVLLTSADQPAWTVEAGDDGLRLTSVNPRPPADNKVLQLWALPTGATAPVSLGVIPAAGALTVTARAVRPEAGMQILISLEPPGGAPGPLPTGPVVFSGRLRAVGGA